ncbi:MAG TPA: acyl-CoA dehydrogenase [Actinobacteria bacterium]|nr:acyl-CoA dehydrogenase [Actinomycetota bacterium]
MDLSLDETQELFRRTARDFAARELAPHVREWDRAEAYDPDVLRSLAEVGFLGLTLPAEYGGTPSDQVAYCLVLEELGAVDSAIRGVISVNVGLVGKTLVAWGDPDQQAEFLPGMCDGSRIACFALTEPGSGSDPASLRTTARRDGGDWILDGQKTFITNGIRAGVALVFARTGEGRRGITAFLVPTDAPGFERRKIDGKLGLRAQDTAELFFDGVRVPDAYRLGEVGRGLAVALSALNRGRMSVAAGCVGIARGAFEAALAYAKERTQFGRPIASFQLVQEHLAEMAVDVETARLVTWRVASMFDRGEEVTIESSIAKYHASEAAIRVADRAVQVHGGYGYIDEYPVGKFLRDARVMTLYEGTSEIQKLIIGRHLTGVSAFT